MEYEEWIVIRVLFEWAQIDRKIAPDEAKYMHAISDSLVVESSLDEL